MSITHKSCSQITVIVPSWLLQSLIEYLNSIGINQLFLISGRSLLLTTRLGLFSNFRSPGLMGHPVSVINFYLSPDDEVSVMKSIAIKCQLHLPGHGSIFSKRLFFENSASNFSLCHPSMEIVREVIDSTPLSLFPNLTHIQCTVNKGMADEIGSLLLQQGIVPVITNASGTGLRHQLGLLRIAIPKEKEFISIMVGNQEANGVMSRIIDWAKLDRPGRGFVWQTPIENGIINLKTSDRSIAQAASTEQIIAAIDSIKGNMVWRQSGGPSFQLHKRKYFSGKEILIQIPEGQSFEISRLFMELGITGTTSQLLKTIHIKQEEEDNIIVPQELIRVVVSENQFVRIEQALDTDPQSLKNIFENSMVFLVDAKKAFNFKIPK